MVRAGNNEQMDAYSQAVDSGLYGKQTGLSGTYDNVRRYWEDEITREIIRPHLKRLLKRCNSRMDRLRVLDLGCGLGGSLDLLTGIREREPSLQRDRVDLLRPEPWDSTGVSIRTRSFSREPGASTARTQRSPSGRGTLPRDSPKRNGRSRTPSISAPTGPAPCIPAT